MGLALVSLLIQSLWLRLAADEVIFYYWKDVYGRIFIDTAFDIPVLQE